MSTGENMNKTKWHRIWIPIVFLAVATKAGAFPSQKPEMDPVTEEFISTARYLLSRQDKKTLGRLDPSKQRVFIQEFWKSRDPDPYTEINEFKVEYYNRIADANKLFYEGPTPGWLQDRGRIYITLGPPDERIRYDYGLNRHYERWNYFKRREIAPLSLIFINHTLVVNNAYHLVKMQHAFSVGLPQPTANPSFEFTAKIHKGPDLRSSLVIKVPYTHIWLSEHETCLETTLSLLIKLYRDSEEDVYWALKQNYPLVIESTQLEEYIGREYQIEIPLPLPSGRYRMDIELRNVTDDRDTWKTLNFRL